MEPSPPPPEKDLAPRRRSHGTGTLHVQTRANGRQLWFGRWYAGHLRRNRRIGLKRKRGTGRGMTKVEAEAELRRMMLADRPPQLGDEISFEVAAELMLRELEEIGRKQTTLVNTARSSNAACCHCSGRSRSAESSAARSRRWRPRCCGKG